MVSRLFSNEQIDKSASSEQSRSMGMETAKHRSQSTHKTKTEARGEDVTAKRLKVMLEMQGYQCAISGIELTVDNIELDHIIPLAEGGDHVMSNVQLLCRDVNRMKGTLNQSEFVNMCRRIVEYQGTSGQ